MNLRSYLPFVATLLACVQEKQDSTNDTAKEYEVAPACRSLTWVRISAGTFTMGSPENEVGREDDEYQHQVTLTHDFDIGACEITQGLFEELMGFNTSLREECGTNCPVDAVGWSNAAHFANALSEAEGMEQCYTCVEEESCSFSGTFSRPYDCPGYRLPTEAEWEYAARAGVSSAFTNGGNLREGDEYIQSKDPVQLDNGTYLNDIAWYLMIDDGGSTTHPVGELEPNAWGLYDVSGNVWEWTGDAYGYYPSGAVTDPFQFGGPSSMIERGGSYSTLPAGIRLANRAYSTSTYVGFRLVRSIEP